MKASTLLGVAAMAAIGVWAVGHDANSQEIDDDEDPSAPDCTTTAGELGCWCNDECVPVAVPVLTPPVGYEGDYYVEAFTDAEIRNQDLPPGALPAGYARSIMNATYRVTIPQMIASEEISQPGVAKELLLSPDLYTETKPKKKGEYALSNSGTLTHYEFPEGSGQFVKAHVPSLATCRFVPFEGGGFKGEANPDYWPHYWPGFFSLDLMRTPSFFGDEGISTLESRTFRVEFTVPNYTYPGPEQSGAVKIRAWYIRHPDRDGADSTEVPLIVVTHGGSGEVSMNPVLPYPDVAKRYREVAFEMADVGDVLYWDRRGAGVSEGAVSLDNDINAGDVFEMLEQLHTGFDPEGVPLKIITPDGVTLTGEEAASEMGLPGTAKDTRFLHVGGSLGSLIGAKVATLWATDAYYGQYDFRGLVNWMDVSSQGGFSTFVDSRWVVDGTVVQYPIWIAAEKHLRNTYGASYLPDSSALASVGEWPALFTSGGIQDYSYTAPAGLVEFYNRAWGLKRIRLIVGGHGTPSYPAGEWELLLDDMVDFARTAAAMPPGVENSGQQTQLKKEACRAYRRAIGLPVPEPSPSP